MLSTLWTTEWENMNEFNDNHSKTGIKYKVGKYICTFYERANAFTVKINNELIYPYGPKIQNGKSKISLEEFKRSARVNDIWKVIESPKPEKIKVGLKFKVVKCELGKFQVDPVDIKSNDSKEKIVKCELGKDVVLRFQVDPVDIKSNYSKEKILKMDEETKLCRISNNNFSLKTFEKVARVGDIWKDAKDENALEFKIVGRKYFTQDGQTPKIKVVRKKMGSIGRPFYFEKEDEVLELNQESLLSRVSNNNDVEKDASISKTLWPEKIEEIIDNGSLDTKSFISGARKQITITCPEDDTTRKKFLRDLRVCSTFLYNLHFLRVFTIVFLFLCAYSIASGLAYDDAYLHLKNQPPRRIVSGNDTDIENLITYSLQLENSMSSWYWFRTFYVLVLGMNTLRLALTFKALPTSGQFILALFKVFNSKVLKFFFVFCVIFIYAFIYAHHFLFGDVLRSYYDTWVELFVFGLTGNIDGGLASPTESDSSRYLLALVMYVVFTLSIVITLLNTLIAIMNNEWDKAMSKDLFSKYINERLRDYVSDRHNGESIFHSTIPQFKTSNHMEFANRNKCQCKWYCLWLIFILLFVGYPVIVYWLTYWTNSGIWAS